MKKAFFLIIFVLFFGFWLIRKKFFIKPSFSYPQKILVNNKIVHVHLALTPAQRKQGLSGQPYLCPDCGELFLFPQKKIEVFWMKGMRFPLDIIWIAGNRVEGCVSHAKVPQKGKIPLFCSFVPVDKVLEVPAGFCQKYRIKKGVSFKLLFPLKKQAVY